MSADTWWLPFSFAGFDMLLGDWIIQVGRFNNTISCTCFVSLLLEAEFSLLWSLSHERGAAMCLLPNPGPGLVHH